MSSITADEYRTAAKVDRHHGGQSAAQFYEDNARALESEDLVTQVAMQFAGSTWGGRDAEEQFALAGSERALAYLVGAGRLIPAGGMALTAEEGYLAGKVMAALCTRNGYFADPLGLVDALKFLESALFPATEPAEEVKEPRRLPPANDCCLYKTNECFIGHPAPAEPAEEEAKAETETEWGVEFPGGICNVSFDPAEAEEMVQWIRDGQLVSREVTTGPWVNVLASSPVVPAPTETEWQTLDAVPAEVRTVWDKSGTEWRRRKNGGWKWGLSTGGWSKVARSSDFDEYAPFVAAEVQD